MTPEKCPGCGIKLRPDMLACPNCPMSFPEDDGPSPYVNPLKQSRYYQFVMPALFFAAIGSVVWYLGIGLMSLGEKNAVVENGNVFGESPKTPAAAAEAPRKPAPEIPSQLPSATPPPAPPVEKASPAEDEQGTVIITRVPQSRAPSRASPAPAADEPPRPVREWKLRGAVYDLTTLKPLSGAFLSFKDEASNKEIMTRTDSTGHYRAIVPPLGDRGYVVTIERSGYAPNYLNPATEDVPGMGAARRRELAHGLASTLSGAPISVQAESERPLITDFYLAPRL